VDREGKKGEEKAQKGEKMKPESPKATTAAIIEKKGKILLTRRAVAPFKGLWCIPGGHIEIGERVEETIRREVKEETGLDFSPRFFGYFNEIFPELEWYAVVLVFAGRASGEVRSNEEVSEWKWLLPAEALAHRLAFANREIIEAWIKRGESA
jgi:8-oxo-dGTP diphosphatase